ncbi:MAG: rhodanese-like domain-containing protein [Candidatus Saccharibacteria bacterium]|nr:rhodanese-like domain-containing protein [Candidatus Saccharibacteria bacterium]
MSKQFKIIAIGIIGIFAIVGGWLALMKSQPHPSQQTASQDQAEAQRFAQEYPAVGADNRFRYATSEQLMQHLEQGDGLLFLGFPDCPWCQQFAPIVNEAAKAEQLDAILYFNIQQARKENNETYQKLLDKLKDRLNKDDRGNPRIYAPDVTAFKKGQVVGRFLQETVVDGQKVTPDAYWTTERKARAIDQLRHMIRQTRPIGEAYQAIGQSGVLIDVRTAREFAAGHVADARHLSIEAIEAGTLPDVDKQAPVYVYCRSGNRSARAASVLRGAGFTNVKDLGGLNDVKKLGAMIVK